jgi:hypothetical protein
MNGTDASQRISGWERDLLAHSEAMTFASVPLSRLVVPDDLFCKPCSNLTPLPGLSPLIVCPLASGKLLVLDGCKRFVSFKEQSHTHCACGILPAEITELQQAIFRVIMYRSRPFTLQEQYCLVQWFKNSDVPERDLDILAACMSLDAKTLKVVQVLALCGTQVREAVFEGRIHEENAMNFNSMVGNDRRAFLALSAELRLSQQTEREFLDWLPEIAYARKKSVAEILESVELEKARTGRILNPPQKIQKIRDLIHGMRFPEYAGVLREWEKTARKTFAGMSKVMVVPSQYFEKSRLEVRVLVSSPEDAATVFEKLAAVPQSAWRSLIDPMK